MRIASPTTSLRSPVGIRFLEFATTSLAKRKQIVQPLAAQCRNIHGLEIVHILQILFELLFKLVNGVGVFVHQIPLVHHDYRGLAFLVHESCDFDVLLGKSFGCVAYDKHHVRAAHGEQTSHNRVSFKILVDHFLLRIPAVSMMRYLSSPTSSSVSMASLVVPAMSLTIQRS